MKTKFSGFLTLLLVLAVQIGFAQTKTVTGNVTDADGLPLPGVNILVKGTNTGTQSDFDGKYSIKVSADQTLVFKYLGFKTQEIPVGSKSTVDVSMVVDAAELSEVVVTGYTTTTKTKSTVASQTISAKTIENRPNASFVQTLSGQVAGLNITTASGQPGANSTVNLRGVSSINGNTEPLFIIDGAPVDEDNFRSLNPQDIASIDVLKDAAATAIYGNRGANGVIIIKTRTGEYNSDLKINYTGIMSFNSLQDNDYDLMNSQEQLRLARDLNLGYSAGIAGPTLQRPWLPRWINRDRQPGPLTDEEIASAPTFDWSDFFFDAGLSENHTLSLSSGSANTTQFTSIGYNNTDGILQDSDLKRFNIRNNISGRSKNDKFNYSTNLSLNYSESNEPNSIGGSGINRNYILGAYQSAPYVTPGDYTNGEDLTEGLSFVNTPLFLLDRLNTYTRKEEEIKIIGSINASYQITDDLQFRSVSSMDYQNEILTRAEGPESFNAILFAQTGNETPGFQQQNSRRVFSFNQLTSLNYSKTFNEKHSLSAGLFSEYFKAHLRSFGYFAEGLDPKTFYPGDGAGFVGDNAANDFFVDDGTALIRNAGLFSYFGQVDYDYAETYGVQATVRRDASYRFADSNTWGTFWSASARWNINNEEFMKGVDFVDVLKLRVSYGTAGNQRINGGTYFTTPDATRSLFATGTGYGGANSVFLSQIGNNTLRWETVATTNLGLDFELFDSKLRGSVDVYNRETTDLFQGTPISAINGATSINANTGSLTNKGVDFNLNYDVVRSVKPGDLNINVSLVGNYNSIELQDLPSDDGEIIGIGRNGGKLFEYYNVRYAGVNPANGNLLFLDADGNLTENPDPDADRVWSDKNIIPDMNGSFGLNIDYKNFFLQTQFNYVIGVDRFDNDLAGFQDFTDAGQFRNSRDLLRAWTPNNRVTDIPRADTALQTFANTDRYLRDADFLRLRFLSFGYSVPNNVLKDTGISNARVFVNGENLVTFTEWRGFDAEADSNTSRIYPTPRTISLGLELSL
ncbi:TonB-linked outer membrane protein, SusC/RagA family [Psychroflexus salarius]|uniref:TonB-linked outer membrane protein, SusC/RagA family n=1 Tax=Psychroflexus salarius TaxID=1155689 RepID=A0A1M4UA60_9FLAO|nr:SusC/RagA family TonB-linked outer membrane protein [Psychroflexus salarius]SHE53672.1 TonB-linked outer membrane protein, SusC/RagA family [Psychroflexus salarius]